MSAEIVHQTGLSIAPDQTEFNAKQIAALRQLGVDEATDGDLAVFFHFAARTGLDPFARQIYLVGRNSKDQKSGRWIVKYTIQTGIDGFRLIADRSGKYEGQTEPEWCGEDGVWRSVWLSNKPPAAARVGVWKTGHRAPDYGVAVFAEYAQTTKDGGLTSMWASKPAIMISKCAEALAFRKAFPQDLSGLYTAEEMSQSAPPADRRVVSSVPDQVIDHPITPDTVIEGGIRDAQTAPTPEPITDEWFVDLENAAAKGDLEAMRDLGFRAKAAQHLEALAQFRAQWASAVEVARARDAVAAEAAIAAARAAEAAQAAS
jgi:phage recombination protein Bet